MAGSREWTGRECSRHSCGVRPPHPDGRTPDVATSAAICLRSRDSKPIARTLVSEGDDLLAATLSDAQGDGLPGLWTCKAQCAAGHHGNGATALYRCWHAFLHLHTPRARLPPYPPAADTVVRSCCSPAAGQPTVSIVHSQHAGPQTFETSAMILRLPGCVLEVAAVLCCAFGVPRVLRAEVTINGLIKAVVPELRVCLLADQSGRERRLQRSAGPEWSVSGRVQLWRLQYGRSGLMWCVF